MSVPGKAAGGSSGAPVADEGAARSGPARAAPRGRVRRFSGSEIVYHWAQALPYLFLAASGAALLAAHFRPLDPGWRQTLRDAHWVAGLLQVALPFLAFLAVPDRGALLANVREALSWTRDDLRWLIAMHLRPLYPDTPLPEVGKFNAGQKVNLLLVMAAIPAFAASGLVMRLAPGALLAWYVHLATFAAALPMLCVHLFMAMVNPSTRPALRGVFVGTVSAAWAEHHHARWYRQAIASEPAPERAPGSPAAPEEAPCST